MVGVDVRDLGTGEVCEGFGGAEVREEGAVAGEDVGFGRGGGGGGRGVRPGAGVFGCVGGGEGEGAECDADVEVGEDELDAGEVSQERARLGDFVEMGWKDVRWQEQGGPWDFQNTVERRLGNGIPA